MGLFDVVYENVPPDLMEPRLRKPIHKAWLGALVKGSVGVLYSMFKAWRGDNVYYITHNSQVCFMEAALNDTFDTAARRIYITDTDIVMPVYIYHDFEDKPVFLKEDSEVGVLYEAPVYLYTDSEIATVNDGFIVWVPAALVYDLPMMESLVNRYRLPSKKQWRIETF